MLNANRTVPTRRLVEALWDENPPRSALANLQTYAAALRKGISRAGAAAQLTTSRTGFLLRPGDASLDLDGFCTVVATARRALAAGDAAASASRYAEALSFWRGLEQG